jgi:predicted kinase
MEHTESMSPTTATLFVMVGLPASGKTTRAKKIEQERRALRLTPDEWMIPLFDDNDGEGKRNVIEGRFIWLALRALSNGMDVILDFGVWAKVERSALRALAAETGASCELVYLEIDESEQRRRRDRRNANQPGLTFDITDEELANYRRRFETPDATELSGTELDSPPLGYASWSTWASKWWPTSIQ